MKMRQAVLVEPKKFDIIEKEIPALAPNEVLIRVVSSGLCHSDMPTYYGQSAMSRDEYGHYYMDKGFAYPRGIGHEGVGVIEDVGRDVKTLKVGDWVGGPMGPAFASHIVALASMCIPIPADTPDIKYCLVEPLTCIGSILSAASPRFGDYVAVVGCGMMGLMIISGLRDCGARELIAIDLLDDRLQKAREYGATQVINIKKSNLKEEINRLTGNAGADVVVEIGGGLKGLKTAVSVVRYAEMYGHAGRGKILCSSVYGTPETWDPEIGYELMYRSPILHSTHPWYCEDYVRTAKNAIEGYRSGKLPMQKFITHEFALEEIQTAFDLMASGDPTYLKGIIVP